MIKIVNKLRHFTVISINNKLHEIENELVYKYNLLNISSINNEDLNSLINDNKYYYFDRIAKTKLKNHMSVKDMKDFLKNKGASKEITDKLIKEYVELKYLNDDQYVKSYVSFKENLEGPLLIKDKLRSKGISDELIDEEISKINEYDLIEERVNQQINKNKTKNKKQLGDSIKTYLISKGFSSHIVLKVVDNSLLDYNIDETELLLTELDKLNRKYKKRKSHSDLNSFLKIKLIEKGYNLAAIEKAISESIN